MMSGAPCSVLLYEKYVALAGQVRATRWSYKAPASTVARSTCWILQFPIQLVFSRSAVATVLITLGYLRRPATVRWDPHSRGRRTTARGLAHGELRTKHRQIHHGSFLRIMPQCSCPSTRLTTRADFCPTDGETKRTEGMSSRGTAAARRRRRGPAPPAHSRHVRVLRARRERLLAAVQPVRIVPALVDAAHRRGVAVDAVRDPIAGVVARRGRPGVGAGAGRGAERRGEDDAREEGHVARVSDDRL